MATVHLYQDDKEVTARVLILKRNVNIESVTSWWRAARKALVGKEVPLEYTSAEIERDYIRFGCESGLVVFVDRKRMML
jgi:hypothetical protein